MKSVTKDDYNIFLLKEHYVLGTSRMVGSDGAG